MKRLFHWFARRRHGQNATSVAAAEAQPSPEDMRLLFQVVLDKRHRRQTEGRRLFQELERRLEQTRAVHVEKSLATEPPRTCVPGDVGRGQVSPNMSVDGVIAPGLRERRFGRRPTAWLGRRSRRVVLVAATVSVGVVVVGGVTAFFVAGSTAGSYGAAQAGTLPTGETPSGTRTGRDIEVEWAQNSLLGDLLGNYASGGYLIKRYATGGGGAITPAASCAGLQQGGDDPLSCAEAGLPTGRWQYTVTPKYFEWLGDESAKSAYVAIAPEPPTEVRLANGTGVDNAYVSQANVTDVDVEVDLPSTSLSSDMVHLTISDGSPPDFTAVPQAATSGAGTVSFTGLDLSTLSDGPLTFTANVESLPSDFSTDESSGYVKDTVDPTVVIAPSRVTDSSGWYNAPVTFSATGSTDATSGIDTCDPDVPYSGPDTSTGSVSFSCSDLAGNSASESYAFKFDDTNPAVTLTPARATDSNGWYNAPVLWTPSQIDTMSGAGSCEAALNYTTPDSATASVTRTCTDVAGNIGSKTEVFKFDDTNPAVTLTPARATDSNGWYNAPVLWTPSQIDTMSGAGSCEAALNYTTPDSATASVTRTCTDVAGNIGSKTEVFKFDDTNPAVTLTPARATDSNGWYNAPVLWTPSQIDTMSGAGSCEAALNYTTPDSATASVTRTCTDVAGNIGSKTEVFKFDDTNPAVTLTPARATDSNGWYNAPVLWTPSQIDTMSGAGSCEAALNYTTPDSATASVTRTCTDVAGNIGSKTEVFKFDDTNPTVALSITTPVGASFSSPTLTYKSNAVGSFKFVAAVTDPTSGAASTTFPAIATTGWTHAVETVSTPGGGPYTSSTFSWTASPTNPVGYSITAKDVAGNTSASFAVTFVTDIAGPTITSVASGGGTAGLMEIGDTITFTFSEALDPTTVPTSVTVTEARHGGSTLTITGLLAAPIGIANGYLAGNNGEGTATGTVALSAGNTVVTVTLGTVTQTAPGLNPSGGPAGALTFAPNAALKDVVGNAATGSFPTAATFKLF